MLIQTLQFPNFQVVAYALILRDVAININSTSDFYGYNRLLDKCGSFIGAGRK